MRHLNQAVRYGDQWAAADLRGDVVRVASAAVALELSGLDGRRPCASKR